MHSGQGNDFIDYLLTITLQAGDYSLDRLCPGLQERTPSAIKSIADCNRCRRNEIASSLPLLAMT